MEEKTERAARQITRRRFLAGTLSALTGALLGHCSLGQSGRAVMVQDLTLTPQAHLPLVQGGERETATPTGTPTPTPSPTGTVTPGMPRVVHVRDPDVTDWTGSGWYGSAVQQATVDSMTQTGLEQLTGKQAWVDIWSDLFSRVQPSGYELGQKIAIKVNFNNASGCDDNDNYIDALPHPVKALIAGLKQANVAEQDIWIYDATTGGRYIPDRFRDPIRSSYSGVAFYGKGDCQYVNPATFNHVDSSLEIAFSDPHGNLANRWLPDLLYQATYVVNIPILKEHGIAPCSLGFKNHFGSLNNIVGGGNNDLHLYIDPTHGDYSSTYSPLVDIYVNANIKDKTVLIVGDGVYGAAGARARPSTWSIFGGDYPSSLFFATDPVAIDCVMTDFIRAEWDWVPVAAYDNLFCAEEAGLGVCEGTRGDPGGDPLGSGYSEIDYVQLNQ